MKRSSPWQCGSVVIVAMALLVLLGGCVFGLVGVHQGRVAPPWFDHAFGPVRLIGYSTWNANCPPYTGCDPTLHEAYVVWLVTNRWKANSDQGAYRMIRLPIEHESVQR